MKVEVGEIEVFYKPVDGLDCPQCNKPARTLATINEWEYYCPVCKVRFNANKDII